VIEPGPGVRRADREVPEEIGDRALQPDRRRMRGPDGRERAIGARQPQHRQFGAFAFVQRHPHASRIAP
jgi:hypothetical protein